MQITQGYLPERITYLVHPQSRKFRVTWEDSDEAILEMLATHTAWPCSAESNSAIATATKWASGPLYDYENKEKVSGTKPIQFTMDNKDLTGVRILGLEYRGNGGRAYKVYIPSHNFTEEVADKALIFDLREDTLLYVLLCGQIDKGVIGYPLKFGVVGTALKLIPSPSPVLEALKSKTEERKLAPISKKELTIGKAYTDKRGEFHYVYLGEHTYFTIVRESNPQAQYNQSTYITHYTQDITIGPAKGQLWFRMYEYRDGKLAKLTLNQMLKSYYSFDFVKSKSIIKEVGDTQVEGMTLEEIQREVSKEYRLSINSDGIPQYGSSIELSTLGRDWPDTYPKTFTIKR